MANRLKYYLKTKSILQRSFFLFGSSFFLLRFHVNKRIITNHSLIVLWLNLSSDQIYLKRVLRRLITNEGRYSRDPLLNFVLQPMLFEIIFIGVACGWTRTTSNWNSSSICSHSSIIVRLLPLIWIPLLSGGRSCLTWRIANSSKGILYFRSLCESWIIFHRFRQTSLKLTVKR